MKRFAIVLLTVCLVAGVATAVDGATTAEPKFVVGQHELEWARVVGCALPVGFEGVSKDECLERMGTELWVAGVLAEDEYLTGDLLPLLVPADEDPCKNPGGLGGKTLEWNVKGAGFNDKASSASPSGGHACNLMYLIEHSWDDDDYPGAIIDCDNMCDPATGKYCENLSTRQFNDKTSSAAVTFEAAEETVAAVMEILDALPGGQ